MSAQRTNEESLDWVRRSFGHAFADAALCRAALTHRSAGADHNERLEFLGDAILNCAVARLLYDAHPKADEGVLSRLRAALVSGESLARIAAQLDLGDHLRLGTGELRSGGYRRESILADALEAILGAICLDGGYDAAAAAVERLIAPRLESLSALGTLKDPKTRLQEVLQGRGLPLPVYTLTAVSGDPHEQAFTVTCAVPAFDLAAVAEAASRRRAEQIAADRVLDQLPPGVRD